MANENYSLVCGIEIHVELATNSKMFCDCKNDPFHAQEPNIHTCPVCLGMPGGLPVPNKTAIEWAIKIGQALGCKIANFSKFDRKHYFYPDLPKGYQISQYDQPFCVEGVVKTEFGDVRITRVHLEEDTGKLLHQEVAGEKVSLVDFNRSGVPLVEIVTEPDIHSPEQAKAFTKKLHQIIKYLNVSDADMEKGSMRLEANISVQNKQEKEAGKYPSYKVEVKNLNSFRFIERAITFEMKRQSEMREAGELPKQETRGWNESKSETFAQRSKESAEDYRYFPDPDIPPIRLDDDFIRSIKNSLPELPDAVVGRWQEAYNIKESDAIILSVDPSDMKRYDQLFAAAKKDSNDVAKLATLLVNKKLTLAQGDETESIQKTLSDMKALLEVSTIPEEKLSETLEEIINDNPQAAADFKAGKQQVLGFFIGQVSRKLGKVNVNKVRELLAQKLA